MIVCHTNDLNHPSDREIRRETAAAADHVFIHRSPPLDVLSAVSFVLYMYLEIYAIVVKPVSGYKPAWSWGASSSWYILKGGYFCKAYAKMSKCG